ncbi:MAG: transposase, partial [Candidatus Omnitrophica bacterium]|nr:transposase [Candidatus Omnitrophota bacterium]
FLEVLNQTSRIFSIEIHAYSLMPNHYHLLIHTPLGNLSRAMRHIGAVYTQKINKKHNIDGSLFRGRFKSILVDEDEYLLELVRYIHRNAYKSGIEKSVGQYGWSSYNGYIKETERPEFLVIETVLGRFSKYENEAKEKFKSFIKKEVPKDLLKRLESINWPIMLGGKAFKEKIKEKLNGKEIDKKEIPSYGQNFEKKQEICSEEIKRLLETKQEVLKSSRSRKFAAERRAIIYILRKCYGKGLKEVGEYLGCISYSAVSNQYKLAEQEIMNKAGCYTVLTLMVEQLKLKVKI